MKLRLSLSIEQRPLRTAWHTALAAALTLGLTTAQALAQTPAPGAPPAADQAQEDPTSDAVADQPVSLDELQRRLDVLAAEVEQLRSGEADTRQPLTTAERQVLGLGPAAAAVYERRAGVSVAGYGEMLMQRLAPTNESGAALGASSSIDFLRAILYTGYRFNDRFLFNSEIEFEHGGEEVAIEFAYVEYRVNDNLSIRGGNLLVPLGLVNEFHEPTVFFGARRPETERSIIPATWHENGAGIVGSAGPLTFRAYAINGLDASRFSAAGLRGGRQGGAEATANDWAFAGRADVTPVPGVFVGMGLYQGQSGQAQFETFDVGTTIVEFHGQAQIRGFDVRGLFARASIGDAASLNDALALTGSRAIAETLVGGYGQVAYNVLSQRGTQLSLAPYYRFEALNTQHDVPAAYLADPARNLRLHTIGVELKPISNIVVKADYQVTSSRAKTGRDQFSLALGYIF